MSDILDKLNAQLNQMPRDPQELAAIADNITNMNIPDEVFASDLGTAEKVNEADSQLRANFKRYVPPVAYESPSSSSDEEVARWSRSSNTSSSDTSPEPEPPSPAPEPEMTSLAAMGYGGGDEHEQNESEQDGGEGSVSVIASEIPETFEKYIKEFWSIQGFQEKNFNRIVYDATIKGPELLNQIVARFYHEPNVNSDAKVRFKNKVILSEYKSKLQLDCDVVTNQGSPNDAKTSPIIDDNLISNVLDTSKHGNKMIVDILSKDPNGKELYDRIMYNKAVDANDLRVFVKLYDGKIKRTPENFLVINMYTRLITEELKGKLNLYHVFDISDIVEIDENKYTINYQELEQFEQFIFYVALTRYETEIFAYTNESRSFSLDALDRYMKESFLINKRVIDEMIQGLGKSILDDATKNDYNDQNFNIRDVNYNRTADYKKVVNTIKNGSVRRHTLEYGLTSDEKRKPSLYKAITAAGNTDFEWKCKLNNNKIVIFTYCAKFGLNPFECFERWTRVPDITSNDRGGSWLTYKRYPDKDALFAELNNLKTKYPKGFLTTKRDNDNNGISKSATLLRFYAKQLGFEYEQYRNENLDIFIKAQDFKDE